MTKIPKHKLITMTFCFIAFFGFSQTAISVSMSLLDTTRTVNMSLATVFDGFLSPISNLTQGQLDLLDMASGGYIMSDVIGRVVLSVAAYLITFLLILVIFVITVIGKLNKTKIVMLAIAASLMILSGFAILTVPGIITSNLASRIGFFALFIDVAGLINISLGLGYWTIIFSLACLLVIEAYILYKNLRSLPCNTKKDGATGNIPATPSS